MGCEFKYFGAIETNMRRQRTLYPNAGRTSGFWAARIRVACMPSLTSGRRQEKKTSIGAYGCQNTASRTIQQPTNPQLRPFRAIETGEAEKPNTSKAEFRKRGACAKQWTGLKKL